MILTIFMLGFLTALLLVLPFIWWSLKEYNKLAEISISSYKGGYNSIKSQIKKRPSAPKSMKAKRKLK
jgi:Flp pilus assembly protein TadB